MLMKYAISSFLLNFILVIYSNTSQWAFLLGSLLRGSAVDNKNKINTIQLIAYFINLEILLSYEIT